MRKEKREAAKAGEKNSLWTLRRRRVCGGCVEAAEKKSGWREKSRMWAREGCLLRKIKLHAQLGQRFFYWGCRESDSFIALLGCILGMQTVHGFGVQRVCGEKS